MSGINIATLPLHFVCNEYSTWVTKRFLIVRRDKSVKEQRLRGGKASNSHCRIGRCVSSTRRPDKRTLPVYRNAVSQARIIVLVARIEVRVATITFYGVIYYTNTVVSVQCKQDQLAVGRIQRSLCRVITY